MKDNTIDKQILALRKDYQTRSLDEQDVLPNPLDQLRLWLAESLEAQALEPNAMVLSTCNAQGQPSARVVLLRGLDEQGLTFYTNYNSRKASEITQNQKVAATFFWAELERQVRVEGWIEPVSETESDAYFKTRPRESQLGAWASPQSTPIPDRNTLEQWVGEQQTRFADEPIVPRPEHWGGYRIHPTQIEFWQGRTSRLHDRLCFTPIPTEQQGTTILWQIQRLAP